MCAFFFFFFQAEDGIRDLTVTGVQTCALPISFQPTIIKLAAAYAALGVFHYFLRHRFLTISFHPEEAERLGWKIKWWDFLFYLSFGVVITLAVPVAGVLMVFSFLVDRKSTRLNSSHSQISYAVF